MSKRLNWGASVKHNVILGPFKIPKGRCSYCIQFLHINCPACGYKCLCYPGKEKK